jgi:hypothetical protein
LFEKKKQKTFGLGARAVSTARSSDKKVFARFFQKALLSSLILQHPPQQLHILRKRRIGGA